MRSLAGRATVCLVAAVAVVSISGCGSGSADTESADSEAAATAAPAHAVEARQTAFASPPSHRGAKTYVPLFGPGTPLVEKTQYKEADGTLVTLAGFRPTNRHARERGEPWDAPDEGPGNYFTFPTWYFQNRSFGLMIRDEVPAGRSRVEVSLRVNNGTFIESGLSAFRRVDDDVRDYGWKMNVGFLNPKEGNKNICRDTTLREDCMVVIADNWRAPVPGTPLQVGDVIELSPAPFLDHLPGSDKALIDGGGIRYYSFEQLYQVGVGMRPWYGVAPTLDSSPLPDRTLLGGEASVSYNYSEEPHRVFQQMANNIGIANTQRFVEGRRLFHTSFADGKHSESPDINPVFTEHAQQLGPRFNAERCIGCHALNGRSLPLAVGRTLDTLTVLTAASSSPSEIVPDPVYGLNIQQKTSLPGAPDYSVSVKSYKLKTRRLVDGEKIELQTPVYAFKGPVPAQYSVRQAPQVIGMGLLEAVDEETILALSDPDDANGDGVRGVPNWSTDPETGDRHLGRFGWKAAKASARQQAATALIQDLGVTSPVFPTRGCQKGQCGQSRAKTAISETEMQRLAQYLALLGVPAQRSLRSGFMEGIRVSPEHDMDPALIERGSQLFATAQCVACHVAKMKTGKNHPFAELRDQTIHPYTDLLLHDMGPGLADSLTESQGKPRLWRTSPLWGLGSLKYVQGGVTSVRYLHDGRARTLMEAIGWHEGEAAGSRQRFEALGKDERAAVLAFLESL